MGTREASGPSASPSKWAHSMTLYLGQHLAYLSSEDTRLHHITFHLGHRALFISPSCDLVKNNRTCYINS